MKKVKKLCCFLLLFLIVFFSYFEPSYAFSFDYKNLNKGKVTEEDVLNYFDDAVFVGDSVMLGFKYYQDVYHNLGNPTFLATVSFALRYAVLPMNSSFYPLYKGQKIPVEDALSLMNAKKVFISLGINDVAITGVAKAVQNYEIFMKRIREKNPDIEIYIISTTYIVKGGERGYLNNAALTSLNNEVKKKINDWNVEYIDIISSLVDENGYLRPYYSIDYYVHQSNLAYDIWVGILKDFAKNKLVKERVETVYSIIDKVSFIAQKIGGFCSTNLTKITF